MSRGSAFHFAIFAPFICLEKGKGRRRRGEERGMPGDGAREGGEIHNPGRRGEGRAFTRPVERHHRMAGPCSSRGAAARTVPPPPPPPSPGGGERAFTASRGDLQAPGPLDREAAVGNRRAPPGAARGRGDAGPQCSHHPWPARVCRSPLPAPLCRAPFSFVLRRVNSQGGSGTHQDIRTRTIRNARAQLPSHDGMLKDCTPQDLRNL